jgi:DNA-binding transcriptional ArsR family regulator
MQTVNAPAVDLLPSVIVAPSMVIDLSWAVHAAEKIQLQAGHPLLRTLYEDHPELAQRIRTFWDDDTYFTELQVLAHRAGALSLIDPEELWERLGAACTMAAGELTLATESEADRTAILRRLTRLRRSPKVRREYLGLLVEVWSHVGEFWAEVGRPAAEAARAIYDNQLSGGTPWYELHQSHCEQFGAVLPDLLARPVGSHQVLVVPCYFFGTGLVIELPGTILLGVPAARADLVSRARTEALARRLKTLADPTRLAILDYLTGGPQAVGEIARAFGLAQPTVSTHVKHLREAGMVSANRTGTRVELAVDQRAIGGLLDELRTVVG